MVVLLLRVFLLIDNRLLMNYLVEFVVFKMISIFLLNITIQLTNRNCQLCVSNCIVCWGTNMKRNILDLKSFIL